MVMTTNRRHKQLYGTLNKGLVYLLEFWYSKGKQAMNDYIKQMDEEEKKAQEEEALKQKNLARKQEKERSQARNSQSEDLKD